MVSPQNAQMPSNTRFQPSLCFRQFDAQRRRGRTVGESNPEPDVSLQAFQAEIILQRGATLPVS